MKMSPHHDHDLGLQHDLERIAAQIALMTPSLSGDATNGFTGNITIGVPA
jgi:hypothetical protein